MLKRVVITAIILCFSVAVAHADDESACRVGKDADRAVILVEKAEQYVADHGSAEAIKAFHDQDGEFIDGELYILFYSFDGTCLANGFKPQLAGFNRYDVRDPNGVYQIREMIELAKKDGGWVNYMFESPVSKKLEHKSTYVKKAPGMDAFVGCGIYGLPN